MKTNGSSPKSKSGLITALDVGTSKVVCFIARPVQDSVEIIGIGHQVSRGLRNGNIVDMDAAEESIRSAVESAEQMAGENVRNVIVNISSGMPESKLISFDVEIAGHEISEGDLRRTLDPEWLYAQQPDDRQVIHVIPVAFSIDGTRGVRDPRGMYGDKLGVNMHVITASTGPMRNMAACVARCHLDVEKQIVSAYASGVASLVEDEKKLGVTCIDMGGGTTTISVFFDGEIIHADSVPIGGTHVTNDIARGLSTTVDHAERTKTLYGSPVPSPSDDAEMIKVPLVGESDSEFRQVPRSMLVGIIRPRIEEIFEIVRARLDAAGSSEIAGRRVVLTGGASQMTGVAQMAAQMLDKQVRQGRPIHFRGLAESMGGPAFSTCAGMVKLAMDEREETSILKTLAIEEPSNRFGRLGMWIRENI